MRSQTDPMTTNLTDTFEHASANAGPTANDDALYERIAASFLRLLAQVEPAHRVVMDDGACLGCLEQLEVPALYCGVVCEEEAALIRYVRRTRAGGGLATRGIRRAIATRLLMLSAGGYDRRAHALTPALRRSIIARDGGLCAICGKPGKEVDHRNGPSPDPTNLRMLCRDCNAAAMRARVRTVNPNTNADAHRQLTSQYRRLAERIVAVIPARPCDDHEGWPRTWRSLLRARRKTTRCARAPGRPAPATPPRTPA